MSDSIQYSQRKVINVLSLNGVQTAVLTESSLEITQIGVPNAKPVVFPIGFPASHKVVAGNFYRKDEFLAAFCACRTATGEVYFAWIVENSVVNVTRRFKTEKIYRNYDLQFIPEREFVTGTFVAGEQLWTWRFDQTEAVFTNQAEIGQIVEFLKYYDFSKQMFTLNESDDQQIQDQQVIQTAGTGYYLHQPIVYVAYTNFIITVDAKNGALYLVLPVLGVPQQLIYNKDVSQLLVINSNGLNLFSMNSTDQMPIANGALHFSVAASNFKLVAGITYKRGFVVADSFGYVYEVDVYQGDLMRKSFDKIEKWQKVDKQIVDNIGEQCRTYFSPIIVEQQIQVVQCAPVAVTAMERCLVVAAENTVVQVVFDGSNYVELTNQLGLCPSQYQQYCKLWNAVEGDMAEIEDLKVSMDVVRKLLRDFYHIVKAYTGIERITIISETEAEDCETFVNLFMTNQDPGNIMKSFKGFESLSSLMYLVWKRVTQNFKEFREIRDNFRAMCDNLIRDPYKNKHDDIMIIIKNCQQQFYQKYVTLTDLVEWGVQNIFKIQAFGAKNAVLKFFKEKQQFVAGLEKKFKDPIRRMTKEQKQFLAHLQHVQKQVKDIQDQIVQTGVTFLTARKMYEEFVAFSYEKISQQIFSTFYGSIESVNYVKTDAGSFITLQQRTNLFVNDSPEVFMQFPHSTHVRGIVYMVDEVSRNEQYYYVFFSSASKTLQDKDETEALQNYLAKNNSLQFRYVVPFLDAYIGVIEKPANCYQLSVIIAYVFQKRKVRTYLDDYYFAEIDAALEFFDDDEVLVRLLKGVLSQVQERRQAFSPSNVLINVDTFQAFWLDAQYFNAQAFEFGLNFAAPEQLFTITSEKHSWRWAASQLQLLIMCLLKPEFSEVIFGFNQQVYETVLRVKEENFRYLKNLKASTDIYANKYYNERDTLIMLGLIKAKALQATQFDLEAIRAWPSQAENLQVAGFLLQNSMIKLCSTAEIEAQFKDQFEIFASTFIAECKKLVDAANLPQKALENGQKFGFEQRKIVKYEAVEIGQYIPPPLKEIIQEQQVCLNILGNWQRDDTVALAELPGYVAEVRERAHLLKVERREKVRKIKEEQAEKRAKKIAVRRAQVEELQQQRQQYIDMGYLIPPELEGQNLVVEEHAEENPEEEVSASVDAELDQAFNALEPAGAKEYRDETLEQIYDFAKFQETDLDLVEEIAEEVFEPSEKEKSDTVEEKVEEEEKTESEHEDLTLRPLPETVDMLTGEIDLTQIVVQSVDMSQETGFKAPVIVKEIAGEVESEEEQTGDDKETVVDPFA